LRPAGRDRAAAHRALPRRSPDRSLRGRYAADGAAGGRALAAPLGVRRRAARGILPDGRLPGLLGDTGRRKALPGLHDAGRGRHGPGADPVTMTVAVVGAGPAGVRAVVTLLAHGLRPVWIDEAPRPGGQIYRRPPAGFRRPPEALYGFEAGKA